MNVDPAAQAQNERAMRAKEAVQQNHDRAVEARQTRDDGDNAAAAAKAADARAAQHKLDLKA